MYKVVRMPRGFLYACDHEILVLSRDILFGEIKSLQISESLDLFGEIASLHSFVGRIVRVWPCFVVERFYPVRANFFIMGWFDHSWDGPACFFRVDGPAHWDREIDCRGPNLLRSHVREITCFKLMGPICCDLMLRGHLVYKYLTVVLC